MRPKRPGVVTFIGVVLYIQAFLAAVAAVVALAFRDDVLDALEGAGAQLSDGQLTGSIIGEAIVAVLLLLVAGGVMRGANWSRAVVAIVEGIAMGTALWIMIVHHSGAFLYRGLWTLFIGFFVLWALYGNERSEAYFDATSG